MGIVDALKASGFVPEKSTEGEFQPLEGTYKVTFAKSEQVTSQRDQTTKQLQVEFKVTEAIDGRESFYNSNEFRKYLALEGDKSADKKAGIPWIINALFTAGYEVDKTSDDSLLSSIQSALGTTLYVRAWGWKPEDGDKTYQQFSVIKESVALKKVKKTSVGF